MEHKSTPVVYKSVSDQGLVECYFAVMGNVDLGGDVLMPGSFKKTIAERGTRVKVLNNHQISGLESIIGVPVSIQEVSRNELPQEILERFPEASGAVKAVTQFLLDTPEGRGAFARIKAGAVDEWSFGYDPVEFEYADIRGRDGKSQRVRKLKQVRLWEYSPVIWAMNPATTTLGIKSADNEQEQPAEAKPWAVFERDGKYYVYKIDEAGNPVGDPLGEHATREEADAQVQALYASELEPDTEKGKPGEPYPWDQCMEDMMKRYGDEDIARRVCGKIRASSTLNKTWRGTPEEFELLEAELDICPKHIKAGRVLAQRNVDRIMTAVRALVEALQDAGIINNQQEPQVFLAERPVEGKASPPDKADALLAEVEQYLSEIEKEA